MVGVCGCSILELLCLSEIGGKITEKENTGRGVKGSSEQPEGTEKIIYENGNERHGVRRSGNIRVHLRLEGMDESGHGCMYLFSQILGLAAARSSIEHHQNPRFAGRSLQSSEGQGNLRLYVKQ